MDKMYPKCERYLVGVNAFHMHVKPRARLSHAENYWAYSRPH